MGRLLSSFGKQNPLRAPIAGNPSAPGFFCRDYEREQCLSIKDHFGFIHGERKWLKQICVACWTRLRQQESHRKISSDCPLKALVAKDSPATPKNQTVFRLLAFTRNRSWEPARFGFWLQFQTIYSRLFIARLFSCETFRLWTDNVVVPQFKFFYSRQWVY